MSVSVAGTETGSPQRDSCDEGRSESTPCLVASILDECAKCVMPSNEEHVQPFSIGCTASTVLKGAGRPHAGEDGASAFERGACGLQMLNVFPRVLGFMTGEQGRSQLEFFCLAQELSKSLLIIDSIRPGIGTSAFSKDTDVGGWPVHLCVDV